MINKEKVHELVRLFYRPTYKTFYVNSTDGREVCKPLGVFVSLGMTTAWETMVNIRDLLNSSNKYRAKIVEIGSIRIGDQYVNRITNETDPKQYILENLPKNVMTKEECDKEYESLQKIMNTHSTAEVLAENAHKYQKLCHLRSTLDKSNGWDTHLIQKDGDCDYRIYHLLVNYEQREGTEYRVGIYIEECNDEKEMP